MAALYNSDLKPIAPGESTHPYDHATKLFLADTYRLTPKQKFLYYVVINVDPGIYLADGLLGTIAGLADRYQSLETGMLVRNIDLPKFTIDSKTHNAYNRKVIVQNNISYEPINITFHDDAADVILNFWNDYYTYYFRDSDYGVNDYRLVNKYSPRTKSGWGYSPRNGALSPFISNIRIFSLHNKRFTEYFIVNPIITSWKHDDLDSYEDRQTMTCSMTINYESVKYFTGYINPVHVDGFSLLHYDNVQSPISTSITNIYSDAGLLGSIEGTARDLAKPDQSSGAGGPLSTLLTLYRAYNNLKNVNLKNVVGITLGQIGANLINRAVNAGLNYAFPILSPGTSSQIIGSSYRVPPVGVNGITINGQGASIIPNSSGSLLSTLTAPFSLLNRGVQTNFRNYSQSGRTVFVADSVKPQTGIQIQPGSLQTTTGTTTAFVLNDSGEVIAQLPTTKTAYGAYNPSNKDENLQSIQTTADESNNEIEMRTYLDGTKVTFDLQGNQLGISPGNKNTNVVNINPTNTRDLAAAGNRIPTTGQQFYTDPTTGVVYSVGGTTAARVTNTLTGVAGAVTGITAGVKINQVLNNTSLGRTVLGRTLSAAVGTVSGATIGRVVNNGLQTILNPVTRDIVQGWNDASGEIRNIVGKWTGSGGFNPSRPNDNMIVRTPTEDGTVVATYKDGTVVTTSPSGEQSIIYGTANQGTTQPLINEGSPIDIAVAMPSYNDAIVDNSGTVVQADFGSPGIEPGPFASGGSIDYTSTGDSEYDWL